MNQNDTVLARLKVGSITQAEAAKWWRIWRLAARIKDLRNMGHDIRTDMIGEGSTRYARYTLMRTGK